jgi:hypothetical protein
MPGTMGQSDLFRVAILGNGSFGVPENLGPEINTEGRETFPYLSVDNELYFASDGHLGLGGLDIFVSKINHDDSFSKPFNIGHPINTAFDDFSYVVNNKTHVGYFSSNRLGGKGSDDIYKFIEKKSLFEETEKLYVGKIVDALFGKPIENVIVTFLSDDGYVIDTEGSELAILSTLDFKRWSFKVICCEHAYTEARGPLHELLSANGYERVHEEISQYDDWYVRRDILRTKGGASA